MIHHWCFLTMYVLGQVKCAMAFCGLPASKRSGCHGPPCICLKNQRRTPCMVSSFLGFKNVHYIYYILIQKYSFISAIGQPTKCSVVGRCLSKNHGQHVGQMKGLVPHFYIVSWNLLPHNRLVGTTNRKLLLLLPINLFTWKMSSFLRFSSYLL